MLAGLVILLALTGVSFWLASQTNDIATELTRLRAVRTLSASTLELLLNAETGQRGFLLTDDRQYLQPYEEAGPQLNTTLETLGTLVASDPNELQSVARLTALKDAKLSELAKTIDLATTGHRDAALELVQAGRGKHLMDEMRSLLDSLTVHAEARVVSVLNQLNSNANILAWTTFVGSAFLAMFAGAAFWIVARYTKNLVEARHEVEALNIGLEQKVADRTSMLSRANDEIQRFAYIVSHDLRAPLVNIMGFTGELEAGTAALQQFVAAPDGDAALSDAARTAANEDLPEAVRFIRASTAKMDVLINAILKLSREGRRELNPEPVDLRKLFAATIASVRHQLDTIGAQIELPERFPMIVSDRLALEQIFGNLTDNAVKYLSPDRPGQIAIQAEQMGDYVQLTIVDNGRGIAPQDHERIFDLFRRSGAQDRPGEGIGLAHVRALVRRLGGEITVHSKPGAGAAFKVILPKILKKERFS